MRVRSLTLLREVLAARGRSYRDIADEAGINYTTLALLAAGTRSTCTTEVAKRICRTLSVDIDLLFVPRVSSADERLLTSTGKKAS